MAHFENPKNVGVFKDDPLVKTATVGSETSGRIICLQAKIKDDVVIDTKMKVYGDVATIAIASFVSEWLKGKKIDEAKNLKESFIMKELCLSSDKLYSALLAVDAIKAL